MNSNLPISSAIQKIVALFGYEADISVNDTKNGKVYCVVDEKEEDFLNRIVNGCELLPPILVVSSKKIKDNPPLGLFKSLSEKYPDRFQYLECPFDIAAFISAKQKLSNQKRGNPFKNFSNIIKDLKVLLSDSKESNKVANYLNIDSNSTGIFSELSKIASEEKNDENRLKRFHGISSEEDNMRLSLAYECCLEYIYAILEKDMWRNKKILWIENKPQKHFKNFLEEHFGYKFTIKETSKKIKACHVELKNNGLKEDFDLILIDIFLGDDEKLSGKDFLKILTQKYPHIPAFILSGSEDLELVSKTLKEGADFYIFKKYAISIPYYFRKFHERIGEIVLLIGDKEKELRRNLIGNIRTWRLNREKLWFGDKCYHMINHSFNHAENDWKLLNQIFPKFYKELSFTDEDIYCLSMATWLHDIGHAGNEQYGEPHFVRDTHSVISAEIILKHPEHYGIFGYGKRDSSPYRYANFRRPKTVLQHIRDRIAIFNSVLPLLKNGKIESKQLQQIMLEKIALMCIYHSSKFPIDEMDVGRIAKKKSLSLECYENLDRKTEPIHLASIASLIGNDNVLRLTSILRIIDGLDHSKNRVGDDTARYIMLETNRRDIRCQLLKLEREVNLLTNVAKLSPEKTKRFRSLFFERVENNIIDRKGISDDLKREQQTFLDSHGEDINTTNYYLLLEYIQFICVQDGHFDLHNSIENIEINISELLSGKLTMDIKFITSRTREELQKIEIKKWDDKEAKSLPAYLLGTRKEDGILDKNDGKFDEGYIGKEIIASRNYIEDFIDIDGHTAGIYDLNGKLLFPEKT